MVSETTVMSVVGPVQPDQLGITLMHEHIFSDLSGWLIEAREATQRRLQDEPVELGNLHAIRRNPLLNRDTVVLDDVGLAISELTDYKLLGGNTIVDVTPDGVGRDPLALQRVARATGLNVIAGCGHYVAHIQPSSVDSDDVEAIARRIVDDLTVGIGETGVRAGIIGEIGTSNPMQPREEKVLRAAAQAQLATGVTITVHVDLTGRAGHEVLDVLESAGARPSGIVLGHLDSALAHPDLTQREAIAYHQSLAERGCFVEYDICGASGFYPLPGDRKGFWLPSDRERAIAIAELLNLGFENQVLISQDVSGKLGLTAYGGPGYGHILRDFTRMLEVVGVDEHQVHRLLIENPRSALTPSM